MKIILLALMCVNSCLAVNYKPLREEDLTNPAIKVTLDEKGDFKEVIVLQWHDAVYTKKGHVNYTFVQGFDYQRKQGFLRTYDVNKALVNESYSNKYDGIVAREELIKVFEIFKSNPQIQQVLADITDPIRLHGGFSYTDEDPKQACYAGNRCVHVFASTPSDSVVAHAIVKLTDKSIPYPFYDAEKYTKIRKRGNL